MGKKLYWRQGLLFSLKGIPRIFTFLCKGIIFTAFMDDFIYQAEYKCKVIFEVHVIAMVFICYDWSINLVKTFFLTNQNTY